MLKKISFLPVLLVLLILAGCAGQTPSASSSPASASSHSSTLSPPESTPPATPPASSAAPTAPSTVPSSQTTSPTVTEPPTPATFPMRTVTAAPVYPEADSDLPLVATLEKDTHVQVIRQEGDWTVILWQQQPHYMQTRHLRQIGSYLIVIDAGHQRTGNLELEPVGPGSSQMKYKVTGGTMGRFTGLHEYKLNLLVAQKLEAILLARGYQVVMVRTHHDVDLSNAQRAAIANELYADAFIRIHANGSDDPAHEGIMTICQTPTNPYNGHLHAQSKSLSALVLDAMVASTGAVREFVWETDTMSGINWCQVPVTIVEMGYMTNEKEDNLMATDAYQQLLAEGIASGIDAYFTK